MKTKKVMRESQAKARLRQRLVDLAQGAMGHCVVPDGDEYIAGMAAEMGIVSFGQRDPLHMLWKFTVPRAGDDGTEREAGIAGNRGVLTTGSPR